MTPERWQQVKQLFNSALEREQSRRSAFLAEACGDDESLRSEVESLLSSHERDGRFIDAPAFEFAADLLIDNQSTMTSGQTLGSYRILSTLGRGGMGEVYLAEDTRLRRKVALKILPSSLAGDQDRLRRFEGEARAASALNHPNILTIYEIGSADSRQFIATEYVDGETLRQRMVHSRLAVAEALDIAIQVASALAAANQAGIVHRDIKPENIMLRRDGYVKVVDFGLAKLTETANLALDTSQPTALQIDTAAGTVMGTTAYMSPEQSRAFVVDARSDIWSLGVVLYEMISGHAPFRGQTTSDLIVSILEREPISLTNLSTDVPEELAWIVTKTLTKNRDDRYQTAREMLNDLRRLKQRLDLATEMERSVTPSFRQETPGETTKSAVVTTIQTDAHEPGHTTQAAVLPIEWMKRKRILAALSLVTAAGMLFGIYKLLITKSPQPDTVPTSQVISTKQITFSKALDDFPSLSTDGNSIAYSSDQGGNFEIYVRQLAPGGREFSLTSDGRQNVQPAWSPDGQRIAYISLKSSGIWIVPALGGVPKQLTDFGSNPAWSRDGAFVAFQSIPPGEVGQSARGPMPPSTLWIVASQGGTPKQITQVGRPAGGHGLPSWSPDGKRLAFVNSDYLSSTIWSIAIDGSQLNQITSEFSADPLYAPDGKSIYYVFAGLTQIAVSPETGKPVGKPQKIASALPAVIRHLTISADGTKIAYSATSLDSNIWSVRLKPGSQEPIEAPAPITDDRSSRHILPAFSPDGSKIAFHVSRFGTNADIWESDANGQHLTQVTTHPDSDTNPSWLPGGERIAFLSDRSGHIALWAITVATGRETLLRDLGPGIEYARTSPDGESVAFNSKQSGTINVWVAALKGGEPKQITFDEEKIGWPCWSPDGRYLAGEITRGADDYVVIFPSDGSGPVRQLVSDHGKSWAAGWSPDGDKIVFAAERDGIWNIYWVSVITKEKKQLTNYSKPNAFVRYPTWSPLGNQIVYEYAETTGNIWLMELK